MTFYDIINSLYSFYITKLVLRGNCGSGCKFYFPVSIYNPEHIKLGNRVKIGPFVTIIGGASIIIMNDSLVASNTVITSSGHFISPEERHLTLSQSISIGKNVWSGASSTILPGCHLGDNSVVAAGSVVTKDVPANTCLIQKRLSSYGTIPCQ